MSRSAIVIENVKYSTIADAARHYNIPYSVISDRLCQNWTVEEAFEIAPRKPYGLSINVAGVTYPRIVDAAKAHGINPGVAARRLRDGWTIEKTFGLDGVKRVRNKAIRVGDIEYFSVYEAACAHGLDPETVGKRLRAKWSIDQAFGIAPRNKTIPDTGGTIYCITNLVTDEKYIGLTRRSLSYRLNEHARSMTRLGQDMRETGVVFFRIRKIYSCANNEDLMQKEVEYITKYDTVRSGYNTHAGGGIGNTPGKPVKYADRIYPSITELHRESSFSINKIRGLMLKGLVSFVH